MAAANRKTHAATQPRLAFACALAAFASAMAGFRECDGRRGRAG